MPMLCLTNLCGCPKKMLYCPVSWEATMSPFHSCCQSQRRSVSCLRRRGKCICWGRELKP